MLLLCPSKSEHSNIMLASKHKHLDISDGLPLYLFVVSQLNVFKSAIYVMIQGNTIDHYKEFTLCAKDNLLH